MCGLYLNYSTRSHMLQNSLELPSRPEMDRRLRGVSGLPDDVREYLLNSAGKTLFYPSQLTLELTLAFYTDGEVVDRASCKVWREQERAKRRLSISIIKALADDPMVRRRFLRELHRGDVSFRVFLWWNCVPILVFCTRKPSQ
jgi:hypothetical protein